MKRIALCLGILVPVLYFGTQLVAAQFYPGYSFAAQSASELGSDRSLRPGVLNTGAMLTGLVALVFACALPSALQRRGSRRSLAYAAAVAVASLGAGAMWAGFFPLPDPRHNPRAIGAGAFFVPILFAFAVFHWPEARRLKIYLYANAVFFVLLIPVMSIGIEGWRGALQRVAAAVLYLPVAIVAADLCRNRPR